MQILAQLLQNTESSINFETIIDLFASPSPPCLFIKNEHAAYCYANDNFIQLMGLKHLNQLRRLNDFDLSTNKRDAEIYRDHDRYLLTHHEKLSVKEIIYPSQNQPIVKTMQGNLYPIFSRDTNKSYILGIVSPECKLLKLDFNTLFELTQDELEMLLIRKRYTLNLGIGKVILSKMEIRTLIELFKGAHAGEIAKGLNVKQSTIESYLVNIKNKLAVNTKLELINCIISEKLFEQVMI